MSSAFIVWGHESIWYMFKFWCTPAELRKSVRKRNGRSGLVKTLQIFEKRRNKTVYNAAMKRFKKAYIAYVLFLYAVCWWHYSISIHVLQFQWACHEHVV